MVRKYTQLMPDQQNQIQRGLNQGEYSRHCQAAGQESQHDQAEDSARLRDARTYDVMCGREEAQRRRREGARKLTVSISAIG